MPAWTKWVKRWRLLGGRNVYALMRYHGRHVLRYSTPRKELNLLRAKAALWRRASVVPAMPYRYYIDPTNVCVLHCPLCPTGLGTLGRPKGLMAYEDYTRIVDQIAPHAYVLELYNWGEPFLHPRIFDMIRYAHDKRISVRLSSNLNRYDRQAAESTVASGLDRLIVSVDGATQAVYSQYRRGGDLQRVLSHVALLVDERLRQRSATPFILMRMLVTRKNEHEISAVRQIARDLGVDGFSTAPILVDTSDAELVREWLPAEASHSVYNYDAPQVENVYSCSDLWQAMTINWDGGVSPCCWVHRQEHDLANALDQPIAEIWNGAAYQSARRTLDRHNPLTKDVVTICNRCRGRPLYLKD
jgi:MoaA/NifB/PqqE/SkfB family radical SAM enzyme